MANVNFPDVLYRLTTIVNEQRVNLQIKGMITQQERAYILSATMFHD
jgi:hypothetical protein